VNNGKSMMSVRHKSHTKQYQAMLVAQVAGRGSQVENSEFLRDFREASCQAILKNDIVAEHKPPLPLLLVLNAC